ncbi:MAG: dephospho-CoA kinase [Desulfocapsaceae bacterium]|nr:dephospho-CoA kinase [Desulfocapsaceae bacterium]
MKIAVTGGIATGKSTVCRLLARLLKVCAMDADQICHELMEKGQPGWLGIRRAWGERFFDAEGAVDRTLLRKTVFVEEGIRHELEAILHPLVRTGIAARERALAGENLLVEVPLIYEVGWQSDFDRIVTVYATESRCIQRIIARDRTTVQDARRILAAQMPVVCKALQADSVIDNSGPWAYTCLQTYDLARFLRKTP